MTLLAPRPFGTSGIHVSPLIFGSMRLDPKTIEPKAAQALLSYLQDAGVTTWHSSHEYETHSYFCEQLRMLRPRRAVHVMKLGEPHFDMAKFRRERFVELIEQELRALGTERIDIVQWLLRATPNDDATRLPLLRDCIGEVEETADALKKAGKIGALAVFPYSMATAEFCLPRASCAGLVNYLNLAEREDAPLLDAMQARGQGYLSIRPLAAGKLLDASLPEGKEFLGVCHSLSILPENRRAFALQWPLLHPAVSGVILSVSSLSHAEQAVAAASKAVPDMALFKAAFTKQVA